MVDNVDVEDSTVTEELEDGDTSDEETQDETQEEDAEETVEEDSFFDPSELPEEMRPIYEEMHQQFQGALQELEDSKNETEQRIANLESRIANADKGKGSSSQDEGDDDELKIELPEMYEWLQEPLQKHAEALMKRVNKKVSEVHASAQSHVMGNFRARLDDLWPEWKQSEQRIADKLKANPQLLWKPAQIVKELKGGGSSKRVKVKVKKKVVKAHSTGEARGVSTRTSEPRDQAKSVKEAGKNAWDEMKKRGEIPKVMLGD